MSSPSLASLPPQAGQEHGRRDDDPLARQMRRQRRAHRLLPFEADAPPYLRGARLGGQLVLGRRRFQLLELELQLVERRARSEDCPNLSRLYLAIVSLRWAIIASALDTRASANWRAARSAESAAFSASMSSGTYPETSSRHEWNHDAAQSAPAKSTRRCTCSDVQPAACGRHVARGLRQSIPSSM